MKIYQAKKTGFFNYVLFGIMALVLVLFILDMPTFLASPFLLLPLLFSPVALFLWIYFDTYYGIEEGYFHYRSAFIRGKIDIQRIRSITPDTNMFVGLKPALAMKGMIIAYNRFDKIYIAPEDNDALIDALLAINSNIEIKEVGKK